MRPTLLAFGLCLTLVGCGSDSSSADGVPDSGTDEEGGDEQNDDEQVQEPDQMGSSTGEATESTCEEVQQTGPYDFCLSHVGIAGFWTPDVAAGGSGGQSCPPPEAIPNLTKTLAGAVGDVCGDIIKEVCEEPEISVDTCCYAAVWIRSPGCDT